MTLRAELFSALAVPLGMVLIVQGCASGAPSGETSAAPSGGPVSFAAQIQPIFLARCTECHGGDDPESGLDFSTYAGAMAGSEYGTVIEAGDPEGSLIVDFVESGDMPKQGDPLSSEEMELLRSWIVEGAQNN
jgi:mono/diheme cytochrome c family protein